MDVEQINEKGLEKGKAKFKFSITDTGLGIPSENQHKLFDKFSQADSSTTRKFGGTGLGLAICKNLVKMMGGTIGMESALGKGSTFWFTLILAENELKSKNKVTFNNLEEVRILVIDDIKMNQSLICEQLESVKMNCDSCSGGKEAMKLIQNSLKTKLYYDLILIDYVMPDMNGEELAKQIARIPQYNKSYLILMASTSAIYQNNRFIKSGFNGYLEKPIRKDRLLPLLSFIWSKYHFGEKDFFITGNDSILNSKESFDQALFKNVKILVAEDNRVNQEFANEIFTSLGCKIQIVSNGIQALEAAKQKDFDIIYMDINMPQMNGINASKSLRTLKKSGEIKDTPIIALTATDSDQERKKCLKNGMVDYITKPLRKNVLLKSLIKYLPADKIIKGKESDKSSLLDKEILVVEDNKINMLFACEVLESFGCKPTKAKDGIDALSAYNLWIYRCQIWMDVKQQRISGFWKKKAKVKEPLS